MENYSKKKNLKIMNNFFVYSENNGKNLDLLITIGGDGTILWTLNMFQSTIPPPVLGFGKVKFNIS